VAGRIASRTLPPRSRCRASAIPCSRTPASEHGAATALAALTSGAYKPASGERIAVVVCGANTDFAR
jgi:threonine dehydratase